MELPERLNNMADVHDFARETMGMYATPKARFIYRGQSSSDWGLQPSISRLVKGLSEQHAFEVECDSFKMFRSQAPLHMGNPLPKAPEHNCFEWLALMQHYGAPTRLLDWARSFYVALYFAVVDDWSVDGVVWICNEIELNKRAIAKFEDEFDQLYPGGPIPSRVKYEFFFMEPQKHDMKPTAMIFAMPPRCDSQRTVAQRGVFTLCHNVLIDHAEAIRQLETAGAGNEVLRKLVIPKDAKAQILYHLYEMNVSANTLFPGSDGLGRSIGEYARLRSSLINTPL